MHPIIGQIRYVAFAIFNLLTFLLFILNSIPTIYKTVRTVNKESPDTFRAAAVSLGPNLDGNELYTSFLEALQIYQTLIELGRMILTGYQNIRDAQHIF